jgi:hypothetical protein
MFFSKTSSPKSIKLGTNYNWVKEIQVYSNKGSGPLQRGDNHKNGMSHLKIFFSRTTGPIVTRIGTHYSWRERIQVSLKEEDSPFPRGDNSKRVKIHRKF